MFPIILKATAYHMGARHIGRVRSHRRRDRGDKFDSRDFNRAVVLCSGGLDQLEACVKMREKMAEQNRLGESSKATGKNFGLAIAAAAAAAAIYLANAPPLGR